MAFPDGGIPAAGVAEARHWDAPIRFYDSDLSHYVGLKGPSTVTSSSIDYELPAAFPGVSGYLLACTTSGVMYWTPGGGSGTVTSVGMTVPSILSVTPASITTSGTFAVSLASQAQHSVFSGPLSGSGIPAFRALDAADIPSLPVSQLTSGTLQTIRGGTGISALTFGDMLYANSDVTPIWTRLPGTTSSAKRFLSQTGTGGGSGIPAWVGLTATDIPDLGASKITSGTLLSNVGGTGFGSYNQGEILIGIGGGTLGVITPNTTGTRKFLSQTSSASSWRELEIGDLPTGDLLQGTGITVASGTAAILSDATVAVDQGFTPTWTGLHTFQYTTGNSGLTRFSSSAAYSTSPYAALDGYVQYDSGLYTVVSEIRMGKSNGDQGNYAGYVSILTRPAGGSLTERINFSSTGSINLPGFTASRYLKLSSAQNISTGETEAPNTVFAGATTSGAGATVPAFRSLVAADIPSLDASKITTGTLQQNNGGTGAGSYFLGEMFVGNGGGGLDLLAIGSTGQVLTVVGGTAAWATSSSISNISDQVAGSSTDYTFSGSGSYEEVDFGGGDPTLSLPSAGTYLIYASITYSQVVGGTIGFAAQMKNTTDSALIGVPVVTVYGSGVINTIITIAGTKTVRLYAMCDSTLGAPKVISTKTLVGYVKLA